MHWLKKVVEQMQHIQTQSRFLQYNSCEPLGRGRFRNKLHFLRHDFYNSWSNTISPMLQWKASFMLPNVAVDDCAFSRAGIINHWTCGRIANHSLPLGHGEFWSSTRTHPHTLKPSKKSVSHTRSTVETGRLLANQVMNHSEQMDINSTFNRFNSSRAPLGGWQWLEAGSVAWFRPMNVTWAHHSKHILEWPEHILEWPECWATSRILLTLSSSK